jgi:hypothetical protein
MGSTRRARRAARAALRATGTLRGRDRFAARRVDGARAARHRPPSKSRLRPSRTQKRPAQEHENRGEHPHGAVAGHRLAALDQLGADRENQVLFPSPRGGYFDLHNFRNRYWKPAQIAAGVVPLRRVYDLRHTFATFALRAGISTFDLSRYMGASLTMIDRHYGHLARDGREHAIRLLDGYADIKAADVQALDVRWTPRLPIVAGQDNGNSA